MERFTLMERDEAKLHLTTLTLSLLQQEAHTTGCVSKIVILF
ncbi:hypothetical protein [Sulfurovum sp.]